jgi:hypothetical protein
MNKRLLRWLSVLVALFAGIYFIRYAYLALAGKDLSGLLSGRVVFATAVLTACCTLLIPITALAWGWLLGAMGEHQRFGRLLPILATTQFGKYLPGNVAQHIGRLAMVRDAGVRLPVALFSMAYEMLLVLVACAHIGALTLLWEPPPLLAHWGIAGYRVPLLALITLGALAALLLAPRAATWLAMHRATRRGDDNHAPPRLHLNVGTVGACYAVYATNFCLIGAGLWLVSHALLAGIAPAPNPVFLTGAFAGSWILGFIAPGAPAGLGIREAILSAWLSGAMPAEQVVLLVVALRIATTLGDLLNFALGSAFMLRRRRRQSRA